MTYPHPPEKMMQPESDLSNRWMIPPGASPDYSIVVPFYNEAETLGPFLQEILILMRKLPGLTECIFINDGSTDRTLELLQGFAKELDPVIWVIDFPVNRGQGAALYRGLVEARGNIVCTLDGDGQNDPADIPMLLEKLDAADLVCGIRVERKDSGLRRGMSRFANGIRSRVLGDGVQDSGCAIKVMKKNVVRSLLPIRTLYSFIPALATAAGFTVTEIAVRHRERKGGRSNYGLRAFAILPLIDMLGLLWYRKRCVLKPGDCGTEKA